MSDNETSRVDKDGDYSDWIELYNNSNQDVNLLNYYLSDDDENLKKWQFPSVVIPSKGYLLVFASKKNIISTNELHTNFKIDSDGEALFLCDPNGDVIDQSPVISLPQDQSYGRVPDGGINWVKMKKSSGGNSNISSNMILFSHPAGFYKKSFSQELNAINGDTIYYTLNGSVPTTNSNLYSGPILIESRNHLPNKYSMIPSSPRWVPPLDIIDKSTTLRCASFKNGKRTSEIYTNTFFVDKKAFNDYTMPIISLVTDSLNFFDDDTGIYVRGSAVDTSTYWSGNYFLRGRSSERPIHIEYFSENGDLEISQDAGVRIHGGFTRGLPQKSFRMYARGEYGEKKFNHQLLPNREVDKYDCFILRTAQGSWYNQTIMQDMLCQDICRNLNVDGQDVRPVLVFLNGEYWGIYTLRDRLDENYIEYMHDIDDDSIEIKENWQMTGEPLQNFCDSNDLSIDKNYQLIQSKIDLENYIDYQIAQQFFVNYDWPGNNVKMWRKKGDDGRWRWIYHDLDGTFGSAAYPMIRHCTRTDTNIEYPNPPYSTFLFRNLLKNPSFVQQFTNRYEELLHSSLSRTTMSYKLQRIKKRYAPEIYRQSQRWQSPENWEQWEHDIDSILLPFLNVRSCYVEEYIPQYLDAPNFKSDCKKEQEATNNQLTIAPNPSNGVFTIHNSWNKISNARIVVYNSSLQEVYHGSLFDFQQFTFHTIDLQNLPNQTYFLKLYSDEFSEVHKLVILK